MVNRQMITKDFFFDLDEVQSMQVVPGEGNAYQVLAVTKSNSQVILYVETESGKPDKCTHWIMENWIKKRNNTLGTLIGK